MNAETIITENLELPLPLTPEQVITAYLEKMAAQCNRSTAAPYFYIINSSVEVPAHPGCGETTKYYEEEDPEENFESVEAYVASKKEASGYADMLEEEKEEFDEKMESAEYDLVPFSVSTAWEEHGMFLTEEEAKSHLKLNHYHYSADAHTYVKHSWRAPELAKFMEALFEHFKVDAGKYKI